jgi:carbon storage regulator
MLVLSRRQTDSIFIGPDIEVTVLSVTGGRVKLGIAAPKTVRVVRSEIMPMCEVSDPARMDADRTKGPQRRRTKGRRAQLVS